METIIIIVLALYNIWTVWYFTKEEKERCRSDDTNEVPPPPLSTEAFELVPRSKLKVHLREKTDVGQQETEPSEAVKPEDVTFEEKTSGKGNSAQVADKDLDEVFKDYRIEDIPAEYADEEDLDVPQAKGRTFNDIDLAIRIVKEPKAGKEDMVEAGQVFQDLEGTELFAKLINDEKLFEQIEASINLAVREMKEKKGNVRTSDNTVLSEQSDKGILILPDRYEDFNILDFV